MIVHTDVPCELVGDIIRRERIHPEQARALGGWAAHEYDAYGAEAA